MKLKRTCSFLIVVLLILFSKNTMNVAAMNTGFSTEKLPEEPENVFLSNINLSFVRKEPEKRGILCFDVNEQGMIAICQSHFDNKTICIYTSRGEFLYGYTLNCSQSICVEWDEMALNVYFVRSDVIISLDSNGSILDIKAVQDTVDNNSYRNSLLYSTRKTIDDATYLIRNDMGILNWIAPSYSQIVTINAIGTELIIYGNLYKLNFSVPVLDFSVQISKPSPKSGTRTDYIG